MSRLEILLVAEVGRQLPQVDSLRVKEIVKTMSEIAAEQMSHDAPLMFASLGDVNLRFRVSRATLLTSDTTQLHQYSAERRSTRRVCLCQPSMLSTASCAFH
ncbi:hypothetical protein RRG08_036545 [Elysia crispata]|uniref:Uncharacterized protein n=1 Tax=Elysia crispata TaxID=231223 RepID=A0AAE0XYE1_9GAST|nr:hypothetical protein RRG08_036545 [Elysia crispata]